jgi:hypothetical protein
MEGDNDGIPFKKKGEHIKCNPSLRGKSGARKNYNRNGTEAL